jgi:phage baseplate assembly protein V
VNPLKRAMDPMLRRVMLMVGRAVLELVNDASKMQSAQVSLLDDEVRDNVERFQNYGFTSVPEAGAEGVALSVTGNRDHVILVAVDDRRYRKLGMQPGEVAVYTKWGDFIHLKQSECLVQHSTKITATAPSIEANGNVQVNGNLSVSGTISSTSTISAVGQITGAGKSLSTHVHSGVQIGSSNTGAPV